METYSLQDTNSQNIQTNLQILQKIHKGPKLSPLEQFKMCKHCKMHENDILNDQITYEKPYII